MPSSAASSSSSGGTPRTRAARAGSARSRSCSACRPGSRRSAAGSRRSRTAGSAARPCGPCGCMWRKSSASATHVGRALEARRAGAVVRRSGCGRTRSTAGSCGRRRARRDRSGSRCTASRSTIVRRGCGVASVTANASTGLTAANRGDRSASAGGSPRARPRSCRSRSPGSRRSPGTCSCAGPAWRRPRRACRPRRCPGSSPAIRSAKSVVGPAIVAVSPVSGEADEIDRRAVDRRGERHRRRSGRARCS